MQGPSQLFGEDSGSGAASRVERTSDGDDNSGPAVSPDSGGARQQEPDASAPSARLPEHAREDRARELTGAARKPSARGSEAAGGQIDAANGWA